MDERLHDYLDGRLGDQERSEFEARMARDPDLAGRVGFYREMRRALRRGPSDLPPGFLARARARFEALHAPRPLWRRYVSWEAAGLVTAGVVVLALLLPLGRRGPVVPEPQTSAEKESLVPAREEEPAEKRREEAPPEAPKTDAVPPRLGEAAPKDSQEPAGGLASRAPREREDVEGAPGSPPEHDRQPLASAAARSAAPLPRPAAAVESGAYRAEEAPSSEPRCQELPEEVGLASGLVAVITSEGQALWRELWMSPARNSLERLEPDFRSERVVLIGPRPAPFGCVGIRVVSRPGSTGIHLPQEGGRDAPRGGCAVVIPAGSSRVEIDSDAVR